MTWHGFILLSFSGAFGGSGVKESDRIKIEKGCDLLVTGFGKTKIMPQYALQLRWNLAEDQVIVEAQYKSEPDKTAALLVLVPEVGVPLDAVMDFRIFGAGKDWQASRDECLDYIEANTEKWNRSL